MNSVTADYYLQCQLKVDRLRMVASSTTTAVPAVEGFRTVKDHFVPQQTSVRTYLRCRELFRPATGTSIFWQYFPQHSFLPTWRVTAIANDFTGLKYGDLQRLLQNVLITR